MSRVRRKSPRYGDSQHAEARADQSGVSSQWIFTLSGAVTDIMPVIDRASDFVAKFTSPREIVGPTALPPASQ